MISHLEKYDLPKNQKRFYSMEVLPNLFGEFSLFKAWGRIGKKGQSRLDWYITEEEAETAEEVGEVGSGERAGTSTEHRGS